MQAQSPRLFPGRAEQDRSHQGGARSQSLPIMDFFPQSRTRTDFVEIPVDPNMQLKVSNRLLLDLNGANICCILSNASAFLMVLLSKLNVTNVFILKTNNFFLFLSSNQQIFLLVDLVPCFVNKQANVMLMFTPVLPTSGSMAQQPCQDWCGEESVSSWQPAELHSLSSTPAWQEHHW